MAKKILIPQDIAEDGKKFLRDKGYEVKLGSGIALEQILADVVDCDAILARTAQFPRKVFEVGKKVRVIGRHGVGVDNIDVAACTDLGVWVTYAPESNASSVAEHTLGFIVAVAHNFVRADREFRAGNFEIRNQVMGVDLEGKTIGVLGLGRIGRMVARKCIHGLGMKVMGFDPFVTSLPDLPEVQIVKDWERVWRESDFITLHLPSSKDTRGIVGAREFGMMKPTAYFVNAARGELIQEGELIKVLQEKKIAGAALDVFEKEPPARDNPLMRLDNVTLSPHNAALTREAALRMALHAGMGIDDVLSGRTPKWPVNKPAKPRT
jgi:D-3-phosphoglycerate dehydrogenase / 2-oxoglutarate reductase